MTAFFFPIKNSISQDKEAPLLSRRRMLLTRAGALAAMLFAAVGKQKNGQTRNQSMPKETTMKQRPKIVAFDVIETLSGEQR